MLDAGCWMLDAGCWMLEFIQNLKPNTLTHTTSIKHPASSVY
ncbi:MAG: hypothetical protein ABSE72_00505 [Bacteroidales bacterium]